MEIKMVQIPGADFEIGTYSVTQEQWVKIMGNNPSYFSEESQCPVECVSFSDIQEFLKALNKITQSNYRLPSEKEWGLAAGGTEPTHETGWFYPIKSTMPVGLKAPTKNGVFDLYGNVWEYLEGGRTLRGGSWLNNTVDARAACCNNYFPEYRSFNLGFRVARNAPVTAHTKLNPSLFK